MLINVILYSTHCPKCNVLEKKLNAKHIDYEVNTSIDEMRSLKIFTAPVLKVGEELMDFSSAVSWVEQQE